MSSTKKGVFILIARLIIGGIFITTGWIKVSAMADTIGYFAQMGIPAFFAYAVGYAELIGGALIVVGLWACLAAFVLGVVMLFAVYFSRSLGFQFFMPPLAILAGLVSLIASGTGKFAVKPDRAGEPTA